MFHLPNIRLSLRIMLSRRNIPQVNHTTPVGVRWVGSANDSLSVGIHILDPDGLVRIRQRLALIRGIIFCRLSADQIPDPNPPPDWLK